MTRIFVATAAAFVTFAACAQDMRFVPGHGPAEQLSDAERGAAQLAIDTLAASLGIAREEIEVDTVRAIEWRDSSIGCPRPGMAYLDVITPGYRVTLRADGQIHAVHEARSKAFVCEQTKAFGGITPQHELTFGPQLVDARRDLAARIGVPEREIQFLSGEGTTWDDASLGCPEPGMQYAQAQVRGWILTFGHGQRIFTYHTDLNRTIPCPPISTD